jgi:hypothetical protein
MLRLVEGANGQRSSPELRKQVACALHDDYGALKAPLRSNANEAQSVDEHPPRHDNGKTMATLVQMQVLRCGYGLWLPAA